ncbi:MAG: excinuclease ABC subunit UvrA [Candidatus Omnitrophica bacterium]|nr:excinuclease ABC subunit UvrA [Candidatus Omnitrophota bacterium]
MDLNFIRLNGVRTHNLKNFDISFPHNSIIVVTGVSGSGKSSLAFDTLYAEGQRRYVESLSAYARQFLERMEKPDLDSVSGILPAIAIEAKNVVTNARSTVGTQTEINDYLRVLYARIGKTICVRCGKWVEPDRPDRVAENLIRDSAGREVMVLFSVPLGDASRKYLREYLDELEKQGFIRVRLNGKLVDLTGKRDKIPAVRSLEVVADRVTVEEGARPRLAEAVEAAYRYGKGRAQIQAGNRVWKISEEFHCAECDLEYKRPTPNMFSFNSPLGACSECQGFGRVITIDPHLVIPDDAKTLEDGAVEPWTKPSSRWYFDQMLAFCRKKGIPRQKPFRELSAAQQKMIWEGDPGSSYESIRDFFEYLERKTYKMHVRVFLSKYRTYVPCPSCRQTRLKPEALHVKIEGKNVCEVQSMTVKALVGFFREISLSPHEEEIAGPVLLELRNRLAFLNEVGLGYLTLDRLSRTLSGGESQRINLATSLGSSLVDTLYVLDEPSIGLHDRDNELLIRILRKLRDLGNTVVVVEHDRQMIETADQVVDLGPVAGEKGGRLVFQGSFQEILESDSLTGRYLSGRLRVSAGERQAAPTFSGWIRLSGAGEHNLKDIRVDIPLGCLAVLTGVSGSGKSTLLYDILYNNYQRFRGRPVQDLGKLRSAKGWDKITDMVLVDQSPIGRTPRSNPVTYIKAFDEIRKIFARTEAARRAGYSAGSFSFNVEGGRCPECEGSGKIKVEMHFLADIYIECERCGGKRYQDKMLDVRYRGKNIHEVLQLSVDEAAAFFQDHAELVSKLDILRKVGLGYLGLGQSALTLSAGEAQRMKLALEMAGSAKGRILYLFDEPTTGLHYHDIRYLLQAFRELIARGHSIVLIEHNMEVIREADYVIDLGPEGGEDGGEVVFAGRLDELLALPPKRSYTADYLRRYLAASAAAGAV